MPGQDEAPSPSPPQRQKGRRGKGFDQTMLQTAVISSMSHARSSSKFSFGTASRFPSASASCSKQLQRTRSSPAFSGQTSTTASDSGDHAEEVSNILIGHEAADPEVAVGSSVKFQVEDDVDDGTSSASSPIRHAPPPAEDRLNAPRIDGSFRRLGEPQQRAALPRARSYDPALTLGTGTSLTYNHAPQFSFGGGKSRVADFEKKQEHLAHIATTLSPHKRKGGSSPSAITLMDLKEATKPKPKKQGSMSRGFGSQARLQVKGGPMELPISPGPGTYEVPRRCDPEPVYVRSNRNGRSTAWSTLTGDRPEMKNPSFTDAGPGEYILDHPDLPFKAAAPSPIFGHPLKELSRPDWQGLEPAHYDLPSYMTHDTPSYSVGSGQRCDITGTRGPVKPGPGQYNPEEHLSYRKEPSISFGKSIRLHQCELVDPDEPPGPGSHQVRKDPSAKDKPSAGLPMDVKLRKVTGLGPDGPAPGDAFSIAPSTLSSSNAKSISHYLPRPQFATPGVGEYDISATSQNSRNAPVNGWASRTSARKPPWREVEQPPVFTLKSGEKLIMTNVPIQFKPAGPKWSMMKRRKDVVGFRNTSEAMPLVTSLG